MKITLAPKPLVDYANALFHGHPAAKAKRKSLELLGQLAEELATYGDHFLSHSDAAAYVALEETLEDLRAFLEDSDESVGAADLKSFVDCARGLMQALDSFEQERQQLQYVSLAPFDQLMVVGVAHLHGRGTREAVEKRLPFARKALKKLTTRLSGCQELFPETFQRELSLARNEVERALAEIESWLSADRYIKLGAGLTRLGNHADKLACLAPAIASASPGGEGLPLGMAELEMLAEGNAGDFELATRRFAAHGFSSLLGFWEEVRTRLLLSANFASSVQAEIDDAFVELEEAISQEKLDSTRVSRAAEDVVQGFWFIRERRLSLTPAVGTPLEAAVFALAGACQGGVADVELEEVLHFLRRSGVRASLIPLEDYLAQPDPVLLLSALEALLGLAAQLPVVVAKEPETSCQDCDATYGADGHVCGSPHSSLSLSA